MTRCLEEFVAHGSNVTCLALGQKSGRVMVTGGEDKKVNLWAIGKPNCIMSLNGHTTSIDCAKFSHNEDLVCAGSASGALKIWDLEAAKLIRTLTGHKNNVRCLDFHPYGDFLSSGSLDTNIKLWDIRKKGCMYTYKGHSKVVNCLRFSPDGRWLASGGDEGSVKLWDLPAGKMLAELKGHNSAITDVVFHPNEFLLASSSTDGTVKFWDLESFQQVSTTINDAGPIKQITFHPDGKVLFCAPRDVLKVFGWEPARIYDTLIMGWGKVSDISVCDSQSQLIAANFSLTNVSVYVVDLKKVQPYGISNCIKSINVRDASRKGTRKNFVLDQSSTSHMQLESLEYKPSDEGETGTSDGDDNSLAEIKNLGDYREIFIARRELCRTPPKVIPCFGSLESDPQRKLSEPSLISSSSSFSSLSSSSSTRPFVNGMKTESVSTSYLPITIDSKPNILTTIKPTPRVVEPLPSITHQLAPLKIPNSTSSNLNPLTKVNSLSSLNQQSKTNNTTTTPSQRTFLSNNKVANLVHPLHSEAVSVVHPVVNDSKLTSTNGAQLPAKVPLSTQRAAIVFPEPQKPPETPVELIPENRDHPASLDMVEFLPKHLQDTMRLGYEPQPEMSESEAISAIIRGHKSLITVLSHRKKNIHIILALWSSKDSRAALEQAIQLDDQAVIVDILNILTLKSNIWTLDICQILLQPIHDLLQSKYESYMSVGCSALKLILKNFAPIIKTNITAPPGIGVDISREERYNKCVNCYHQLLSVRAFILKRQTLQGKLGRSFRELSILMQNLE